MRSAAAWLCLVGVVCTAGCAMQSLKVHAVEWLDGAEWAGVDVGVREARGDQVYPCFHIEVDGDVAASELTEFPYVLELLLRGAQVGMASLRTSDEEKHFVATCICNRGELTSGQLGDCSVRLVELRKENWSVAMYPVENHGFVRPESWADEYKRIFKLFEENLHTAPTGAQ